MTHYTQQPLASHTKNFVIKLTTLSPNLHVSPSPSTFSPLLAAKEKKNTSYNSLDKIYQTNLSKMIKKIPDQIIREQSFQVEKNHQEKQIQKKFQSLLVIRNCQRRQKYNINKNGLDLDVTKRIYKKIKEKEEENQKNQNSKKNIKYVEQKLKQFLPGEGFNGENQKQIKKQDKIKINLIRQLNMKNSSEISYFQKIQELKKNKRKHNQNFNISKLMPEEKQTDQSFSYSECKFKEEKSQQLRHEFSQKKQHFSTIKNQNIKKLMSNESSKKGKIDILPQIVQKSKNDKRFPVLQYDSQKLKHIKAESFIVMEYPSQRIILSNKSNLQVEIASLTKMMTFYVIQQISLNKGLDLNEQSIEVSNAVLAVGGTSAELWPAQLYTIKDLLYGLMLPSGNDAAIMLAIWGGNQLTPINQNLNDEAKAIKIFVQEMNKIAKILELPSTRFANPHGLPHFDSKSSAKDIAKLSCCCLEKQLFSVIVGCKIYKKFIKTSNSSQNQTENVINKNGGRIICWQNTNKLLKRDGFIGLKTGITVTAGPCLASAYKFRDNTFVTVVLRAKKITHRFSETRKILHYVIKSMYLMDLTEEEEKILKKLKKKSESDCSEDEEQFAYDKLTSKQILKRCNIVSDV